MKNFIRILEIFGQELDGILQNPDNLSLTSRGKTVTFSKQSSQLDEPAEKILKDKVLTTLQSLRSNLTLGSDIRTNDPKDPLDPNRDADGNMDEISGIYGDIFRCISEYPNTVKVLLQQQEKEMNDLGAKHNPYAEREEAADFYHLRAEILNNYKQQAQKLIDDIIDLLIQAEKILADSQGTAIIATMLRPYDTANRIPVPTRSGKKRRGPVPYRKRGHSSDGIPIREAGLS